MASGHSASASQVLGWKLCTTVPSLVRFFEAHYIEFIKLNSVGLTLDSGILKPRTMNLASSLQIASAPDSHSRHSASKAAGNTRTGEDLIAGLWSEFWGQLVNI